MSATQQTLAQMIRAKHPGAYDDMDDATLEKNVLAKYPQYGDLPKTQTQAPSTFQKVEGKAEEYAGKALGAAGLPQSISDIPNWFQHLTGTAKDSESWWSNIREAVKNPTQENLVKAVPFFGPMSTAMAADVRNKDYGGAAATLAGGLGGVVAAGQVAPGMQARSAIKNTAAGAAPTATAAERMYQSALKPSTTLPLQKVRSIVRTGLENEIPVSQAGAEKLSSLVDNLNSQIKGQIDAGSAAGKTVNKFKVASRLGDTANKFATQVNPTADLSAVSESGNEFLANQPNEIPASEAQALKQGTYQQLKGRAYGELKSATVESQKALARGLKEELVQQFPEIGQLNTKESQLIGLDDALERAVKRINNHQLMGIGTPLAVGAGAAITGSKTLAVATGVIKAVLDDPVLKSKLAIAMSRRGVSLPGANMRLAAYTNALANAQPRGGQNNSQGNEP